MSSAETPLWWDSEIDRTGRPIRPDVRAAAHAIWACACRQAQCLISDFSEAADLMESTVARVSRYLDRREVIVFSREIRGLLMRAFQRTLHRHMGKLRRLEILGGTEELSSRAIDCTWALQVHVHLEFDRIVGMLRERSRTILALRYAGYTWKEAALTLGTSVPALRSAFWRDVDRVKNELKIHRPGRPEHQIHQDSR